MDLGIRGKVALITGSGQGIGLATALALAAEGADICICDVNEEQGLHAVDSVKALGVEAIFVKADISDENDVKNLFETTREKLGPVEILVNNAGISPKTTTFDKIPAAQFQTVLNVNLLGAYLCSQQAFIHMQETGWGRIVSLASMAALYGGNVAGVHYASSKGGIIAMTKTLARNMGPYQVTVNCVAPGRIRTPMVEAVGDAVNEGFRQRIPLRRLGEPSDVAAVIAFLASEPGGYINGACVDILGGFVG